MHRNARLTHWGRQELVRRIMFGTPIAHVAVEMNVSRPTAGKWWGRYLADPDGPWWVDRSSRPRHCPHQTRRKVERKIVSLRRNRKLGPARIAGQVQMPASTVHRVLVRHGMNRLAWMDRPTGRPIRRYEHDHPGDLAHIDIKKLGRIRPGGGWRAHGRNSAQHRATRNAPRVGYEYIHTVIDDHSRVAYSEILDDEKAITAVGFWRRARWWFACPRHRHQGRADRQRVLLPVETVSRRARQLSGQAPLHPPLPTPDQRQGRTVQPNPLRRMGLRPHLPIGSPTPPGP